MLLCVDTYTQEFPVFILFLQLRCADFFDGLLTPVIHPDPSEHMVFDVNNIGIIWIWIRNQRTRLLLAFIVFLCSSVDTVSSGQSWQSVGSGRISPLDRSDRSYLGLRNIPD